MRKIGSILFILVIPLILISCEDVNRPARGPEDEIIVVADTVEFESLKSTLQSIFEKVIYTPQPEKLFNLKRISLNEIESYQNHKNIIIIAPVNSSSNTSKFIKAILDTSTMLKSLAENNFMISRYNLWAKDQLVLILTSHDIPALEHEITQNREHLLSMFQKESDKRLFKSLYDSRYEKTNTEGVLLRDYGWVIYIQNDFHLTDNYPAQNFICFKNSKEKDCGKWMFVHWIDNASPVYLNDDSIRAIRNRLTNRFYRFPDDSSCIKIAKDNCLCNEVTFNGNYALLTQGLWENSKEMGGPFINYTFYDGNTRRIYMIDGSIYAPKYYKRNLIHQMDVMLQSFKTKADLSQGKIDELLKAAE
jgi:hypothetical protein